MLTAIEATPPTTASRNPVDFYFDFVSPYGWIGAEQIGALAQRFDRCVRWHPFLLKVSVVDTMGLPPLLETPLKKEYVHLDLRRSLRYHGLILADGATFTFSSVVAARATLWVRATAPHLTADLVLALYRTHWALGRSIADIDTVLAVIAELGLPRDAARAVLQSDAIKADLRHETANAIARGVFGSPTMVVDGEMFWGSDRMEMLACWLESGGW